ncbi:tautomerase family protein [Beijerinckia sp. L45]|uniref:tautomerase family protein n=1 Tax=Beijerinckia sp. L45 TaxID=1641855 RepID=UPI00131E9191|nr:tautomerase family protein [Beijerinckia sp. L45]
MPTYVCCAPSKSLSDGQKDQIASAIARRHSEATGAPSFFVQVVIEESETTRRYLGGGPSGAHIWIRGDIRAGRSEAVRGALMLAIMRDVSAIAAVPETSIWVYLCNLEATDMVEFGHVLPKPGEEQAWFEGLPTALQTYLKGLGAKQDTFRL